LHDDDGDIERLRFYFFATDDGRAEDRNLIGVGQTNYSRDSSAPPVPAPSTAPAASSSSPLPSTSPAPGAQSACDPDQVTCLDANRVQVCEDGELVQASCSDLCAAYGLDGGSCDGDCQCGAPSDEVCLLATADVCGCYALLEGVECTPDELAALYSACHMDLPEAAPLQCAAEFRRARADAAADAAFCAELAGACE